MHLFIVVLDYSRFFVKKQIIKYKWRFKMKKIININYYLSSALAILFSSFFADYGGSGDLFAADASCPATVANNSYKIFNPHCWPQGASYTFNLSGTGSDGSTAFTSQFLFTKQNNTTYKGASVSQFDFLFSLAQGSAPAVSYTTRFYALTNTGTALAQVYGNTTCKVTNGSITIPTAIKNGDSGIAYSYSCSDATSTTATWTANIDQASGNIMYALTSQARDQSNKIYVTETDTYYLNTEGIPQRIDSLVKMGNSIFYKMSSK